MGRLNPKVSAVIPCYNEAGNIIMMHQRLRSMFIQSELAYEIIFINNGSHDDSDSIFHEIVRADERVKVISLSRNYGSQNAISCGLEYAKGDCVVCLDGDIQDPPELIPQMVEKWREGFDVVYGVRSRRKGSIVRRACYKMFYRLFRKLSYVDVPLDAGDFALMDRRVVRAVMSLPERNRFMRGLRAWVGFRQTGIEYTREDRYSGKTTNSFMGNMRWAIMGIFSFSYKPLEMISVMAGLTVAISIIGIIVYVILYFVSPVRPPGFTTSIVAILFIGGMQLSSLAIIGEYLGRMFDEVKDRPLFLIDEILSQENTLGGNKGDQMTVTNENDNIIVR